MYSENTTRMRPLFLLIVLLVSISSFAQTKPIQATIDASRTSAPISKYIYGQFLEHIGGIVNNNIWAEMLEDRKFLFPDQLAPAHRTTGTGLEAHGAAPLDADRRGRIRDDGYGSSLCRRAHAAGETEF